MSTTLAHLPALQFNVAGLLKSLVGATRAYDVRTPVSELDQLDESFDVTGPLTGAVRFLRTPQTVLAYLHGQTVVRLECARCLEPVEVSVQVDAEEEFHPSIDVLTGHPLKDRGDDEALIIDEHHILDLSELVRQTIILALPPTPLCRQNCAGLCPTCGANHNFETCACAEEDTDDRWSALSILLEQEESDSAA